MAENKNFEKRQNMEIKVNGELKQITNDSIAVPEILKLFKVEAPDMVSVQLNGEFVDRKNFDSTLIKEKDEIEFLYFMGGGR